jgi:hypothetical protein
MSGEDLELSLDVAGPCRGLLWVPDGERHTLVDYGCAAGGGPDRRAATEEQTRALVRLEELLADPQSALPTSAWQDQTVRAYVPSRYGICLFDSDPNDIGPATTGPGEPDLPPDPGPLVEQLLSLLPAPAAEVLRGTETVTGVHTASQCRVVTTDEARLLDQALTDAGAERSDSSTPPVLGYHLDYPGQDGAGIGIQFEPLLPDGWID